MTHGGYALNCYKFGSESGGGKLFNIRIDFGTVDDLYSFVIYFVDSECNFKICTWTKIMPLSNLCKFRLVIKKPILLKDLEF